MSTAEEQNSPQYFRRQLKEIEPRLSSKKLDEIMRLHNTLLSQHTQRARVIEISTRDTCDYCKEPMKYAGSNDGVKVVRSCTKHLELAKNRLAQLSTKDSTNARPFLEDEGILLCGNRGDGAEKTPAKDSTNKEEA